MFVILYNGNSNHSGLTVLQHVPVRMVSVTVVAFFLSKVHLCVVCCACDFVQNLPFSIFFHEHNYFYYFSKPGSCLCDTVVCCFHSYMRISLGAVTFLSQVAIFI